MSRYLITFIFLFFLSIVLIENILCFSDDEDIGGLHITGSYLYLRDKYEHNCIFIQGNLVIEHLYRLENGSDPDLSFLRSIREITGFLIIMHSNVAKIPLDNLRVIRASYGPYSLHLDLPPAALMIRSNYKSTFSLEKIDFNSLEDCSQTCPPTDDRRYCWGSSERDCQSIPQCNRTDCNGQCVPDRPDECCHSECLGGCTGPRSDQCKVCRHYNNSGQCLARCPGRSILVNGHPTPNPDFKFSLGGSLCVAECPDSFMIENDVCVRHCSEGITYADGRLCQPCEGICPRTCKIKYPVSVGGQEIEVMDSSALERLVNCTRLDDNLVIGAKSFELNPNILGHRPIKRIDQLWSLRFLRQVTGHVYLDLGYFGSELKNLSFLENLITVNGHSPIGAIVIVNTLASQPGLRSLRYVPHGSVLFANNTKLCFLPTLPWYFESDNTNDVSSQIHGEFEQIVVHEGAGIETCASAQCHLDCDPAFGCWGPNRDQCVRCRAKRAGRFTCVDKCSEIEGYYEGTGEAIIDRDVGKTKDSNWGYVDVPVGGVCSKCHTECRQTCTGPRSDQCIGGCRSFEENGSCVPSCGQNSYPAASQQGRAGVCKPCNANCHSRSSTGRPVCSGPGRYPGNGGCAKCEMFVLTPSKDRDIDYRELLNLPTDQLPTRLQCLTGTCPVGTFLSTSLLIDSNSSLAQFIEMPLLANPSTSRLVVAPLCQRCHPLCSRCSTNSLIRVKPGSSDSGCFECRGYWFNNVCVEECPTAKTYTLPIECREMTSDSESHSAIPTRHMDGTCLACHSECQIGCWGPSARQCYKCANFRLYTSLFGDDGIHNCIADLTNSTLEETEHIIDSSPSINAPFICLPTCQPVSGSCAHLRLGHKLTDPLTGDQLCHYSTVDQHQLNQDQLDQLSSQLDQLTLLLNSTLPGVNHSALLGIRPCHQGHGPSTNLASPRATAIVWLLCVSALCLVLLLLFCCCYSHLRQTRRKAIGKRKLLQHNNQMNGGGTSGYHKDSLIDRLLDWFLAINLTNHRDSRSHLYDFYPLPERNTRLASLSDTNDDHHPSYYDITSSRDTESTALDSQPDTSPIKSRPPNLARLIMINSNNLELREDLGPMGNGAFGQVYKGIWTIQPNTGIDVKSRDGRDEYDHLADSCSSNEQDAVDSSEQNARDESSSHQDTSDKSGGSGKTLYVGVAVKILNETRTRDDLQALLNEAKVMASVAHRNCLPLLGICLAKSRKCLVSAYVPNGSLDRYLRVHEASLSNSLLLNWVSQIADGMAYLQSRGIIHRDLATRNVLVTSRNRLQITDFGLAKMLEDEEQGEVTVKSGRVPIRWLAVETLKTGTYSFKSDVWAYGVTIWEIFTFGKKPYDKIETQHVKSHVLSGARLSCPAICTPKVYHIMSSCWKNNPDARPRFKELHDVFLAIQSQPNIFLLPRPPTSRSAIELTDHGGTRTRSHVTVYSNCLQPSQPPNRQSTYAGPEFDDLLEEEGGSGMVVDTKYARLFRRRQHPGRRKLFSSTPPSLWIRRRASSAINPDQHQMLKQQTSSTANSFRRSLAGCSVGVASGVNGGSSSQDQVTGSTNLSDQLSRPSLFSTTSSSYNNLPTTRYRGQSEPPMNGTDRCWRPDSWQPNQSLIPDNNAGQANLAFSSSDSRSSGLLTTAVSPPNNPELLPIDDNLARVPAPNTILQHPSHSGYVCPHWPETEDDLGVATPLNAQADNTIGHQQNEDSTATAELNETDVLPWLNRQLWSRRNNRQRRFYEHQAQMQQHHNGIGSSSEHDDADHETGNNSRGLSATGSGQSSNNHQPARRRMQTISEDSDQNYQDQSTDNQYWPDPTSLFK